MSSNLRWLTRKEIEEVFKKGKLYQGISLFLKIKKNNLLSLRNAIIVPLEITKKSTKRNKIKRQIREILREELKTTKTGFDKIFIAKKAILNKNYREIKKEIRNLLEKTKNL